MEWISVKDRLPEEDISVLLVDSSRKHNDPCLMAVGILRRNVLYDGGFNMRWEIGHDTELFDYFTHWMPIPAPPEVK